MAISTPLQVLLFTPTPHTDLVAHCKNHSYIPVVGIFHLAVPANHPMLNKQYGFPAMWLDNPNHDTVTVSVAAALTNDGSVVPVTELPEFDYVGRLKY